jgi:hypothetical protein
MNTLYYSSKSVFNMPWMSFNYETTHGTRNEIKLLGSITSIIRVIKARRMRWARHVARMGELRGAYKILVGRPEGRNHYEDLGVDGRTTLRWILGK